MEKKIQTLEERLVYSEPQNRWLELYFDRVRFPDGSEGYYNRAVENHGRPGVAIIPLHGDHIGLVHQYRYPVGRHMWEIPRGFGETNDPREDAVRELREETGIDVRTEELIDLGVIHPNSGLLASEVHLYAVRIEESIGHIKDAGEQHEAFTWFPLDQLLSQVTLGEVTDAFTLCALLRTLRRELL